MTFYQASVFLALVLSCALMISTVQEDVVVSTPLQLGQEMGSSLNGCKEDLERKSADCNSRGFDTVPQNISIDVEKLFLRDNNITALFESSFQRYRRITLLDLAYNDITMIESSAFYPLRDITELIITHNPNLVLPDSDLFKWARKLISLDLDASNLRVLPGDILKWSPLLKDVSLDFNELTFINISSCGNSVALKLRNNRIEKLTTKDFIFKCHCHSLNLQNNPIQTVDPNMLSRLNVSYLNIGYRPLTVEVLRNIFVGISQSVINELSMNRAEVMAISKGLFDTMRNCSLSYLSLSFNKLSSLYPYVFSNLTSLKNLHLSGNMITLIEPNYFHGMHGLQVLDLEFNQIESINPHQQNWTIGLNEMYLIGNLLTEVRSFTFLGLKNLTLLDLSYNEGLAVLELGAFSGLDNLQTLDVSECSIYRWTLDTPMLKSLLLNRGNAVPPLIPVVSFNNAQLLEHVEIKEIGLQRSHLWDERANVSLFDGLLNLTTLYLSRNPTLSLGGNLPPGIFRRLSALQELYLDGCGIQYLHQLFFTGLDSLRILNLKGNQIQRLHCDILKESSQITSIYFEGNLLSYLDATLFSNNSMLSTLTLSNNRLTSFNKSTFEPLNSSSFSIDISMNPIDCNCDLQWLIHWLAGPVILVNKHQTICSPVSLDPFREKPLLDFDPSEICRSNVGLFSLIPITVLCLVIVVVLGYRNRWMLRYKFFLLKVAVLGYNEMRDARDHDDYEFDVNIIFYDDDEEWVGEHLRPALQEHLQQFQRNVFGDGDLVLGMHYLDSVDYVVTHSYKTVILLSRAAVRDRWFMLKFRTAMDHVSDTQTEFVVVVFLEDIPDEEIPFLARLYLSDGRPYMYWTEAPAGQEYFWIEFAKNMTINLRTNDLIPNE